MKSGQGADLYHLLRRKTCLTAALALLVSGSAAGAAVGPDAIAFGTGHRFAGDITGARAAGPPPFSDITTGPRSPAGVISQGGANDAVVPPVKREQPAKSPVQPPAAVAPTQPAKKPDAAPPAQVSSKGQTQSSEGGGVVDAVQDWLARANRDYQGVLMKQLSVPAAAGGDAIARKLEEQKAEDAKKADEAKKLAGVKRLEDERRSAADAKQRQAEDERRKAEAAAKTEAAAKAEQARRSQASKQAQAVKPPEPAKPTETIKAGDPAKPTEAAKKPDEPKKAEEIKKPDVAVKPDDARAADERRNAEAALKARETEQLKARETEQLKAREAEQLKARETEQLKAREALQIKETERIAEERRKQELQRQAEQKKSEDGRRKADEARRAEDDRRKAEAQAVEEKRRVQDAEAEKHRKRAVTITAEPVVRSPADPKTGAPIVATPEKSAKTTKDRRIAEGSAETGPVADEVSARSDSKSGGRSAHNRIRKWDWRPGRERHLSCRAAGRLVTPPAHYVVKRGDSLWRISERHYRKGRYYRVIYRANRGRIADPQLIYPCQRFFLPLRR